MWHGGSHAPVPLQCHFVPCPAMPALKIASPNSPQARMMHGNVWHSLEKAHDSTQPVFTHAIGLTASALRLLRVQNFKSPFFCYFLSKLKTPIASQAIRMRPEDWLGAVRRWALLLGGIWHEDICGLVKPCTHAHTLPNSAFGDMLGKWLFLHKRKKNHEIMLHFNERAVLPDKTYAFY